MSKRSNIINHQKAPRGIPQVYKGYTRGFPQMKKKEKENIKNPPALNYTHELHLHPIQVKKSTKDLALKKS